MRPSGYIFERLAGAHLTTHAQQRTRLLLVPTGTASAMELKLSYVGLSEIHFRQPERSFRILVRNDCSASWKYYLPKQRQAHSACICFRPRIKNDRTRSPAVALRHYAERRGFEPLKPFRGLLAFQAGQFNHSCIFPNFASKVSNFSRFCKSRYALFNNRASTGTRNLVFPLPKNLGANRNRKPSRTMQSPAKPTRWGVANIDLRPSIAGIRFPSELRIPWRHKKTTEPKFCRRNTPPSGKRGIRSAKHSRGGR